MHGICGFVLQQVAKAGDKKGDERKTFMSECLKADKKS